MRALVLLLVLAAAATPPYAQSPKREASRLTTDSHSRNIPALHPVLTQEQVNAWVRRWQKRLALEEWQIEARIVRVWDLPENAIANVRWSMSTRKATIKVLNPVDSSLKGDDFLRDTELSVVHEMVHLSLAKLPLDPNHTELEEETVKRISAALLALDQK